MSVRKPTRMKIGRRLHQASTNPTRSPVTAEERGRPGKENEQWEEGKIEPVRKGRKGGRVKKGGRGGEKYKERRETVG